jgi:hypothetical protein
MTKEERNSFANLILLCHPHHTVVDKIEPEKYPVSVLLSWKSKREGDGRAVLAGLRGVTEDRLQEIISVAVSETAKQVENALDRLADIDRESASLLRNLMVELETLRNSRRFLDPDAVHMLYGASKNLQSSVNEDVAGMLMSASQNLSGLPGALEQFESLIHELKIVQRNMYR